jgi:glycosyltransferase involved in cell wall biosynthesis
MFKTIHKVAHLTSAHPRYDTRIFHKMCTSLATQENEVILIVADGKGDEFKKGISILDVGASQNRLDRIRNTPKRVFAKSAALNADFYHLHDPELIPIGLKLKQMGFRVIFDSHEDVPKQMLAKLYLNRIARLVFSAVLAHYERYACKRFDGIIAATATIRDKFLSINANTVDINNYPLLDEFAEQAKWTGKCAEVCYVGGISNIRGIKEMCGAMDKVKSNVRLNLVGEFSESGVERSVRAMPGWERVNPTGFLDRTGVESVFARSMAGLVTLQPVKNYIDALPVKMFEYMSAGIPVIASNFPLWREIISKNDCGLLVNPLDAGAIAKAIDYMVLNPKEAERMGRNGRKAVETHYNWNQEEKNLLNFYEKILQN